MKKLLSIILMIALLISIPVLALEPDEENNDVEVPQFAPVQARSDETHIDKTVDILGFIGLKDPASTMIDVTVSQSVDWWVDEDSYQDPTTQIYDVDSAVGGIKNNSTKVELVVTFAEFTKVAASDATIVENDLTLKVRGDLFITGIDPDLSEGWDTGWKYTTTLKRNNGIDGDNNGDEWAFRFWGEYNGILYPDPYVPTYKMQLEFDIAPRA